MHAVPSSTWSPSTCLASPDQAWLIYYPNCAFVRQINCEDSRLCGRATISNRRIIVNLRIIAKIHDYAAIGDCRSAALVSRYGSIDWLCWPRFDSPSIFAAILDKDKGGYWSISPMGPSQFERAYIRDSNVLETYFISPAGRATLTDLMPVASEQFKRQHMLPDHEFLRQVLCTEGEIKLEMAFCPRPYYG